MRTILGLYFATLLACAAVAPVTPLTQACFAEQLTAQQRPGDILLAVPEEPAPAQGSLPVLDMKIGSFHKMFNQAA